MDDPDSFSGSEEESQYNFNINALEEKEIQSKEIINNYAYPPNICPSCYHTIIHLEYMKGKMPIFLIHFIANAIESNVNIGKI